MQGGMKDGPFSTSLAVELRQWEFAWISAEEKDRDKKSSNFVSW
jgi:hypothetical protein